MKTIELHGKYGKGKFMLVSDEDYDNLASRSWVVSVEGYPQTNILYQEDGEKKQRTTLAHRMIMNPDKGLDVDHINHDKLDNRRENLRIATRKQNSYNQSLRSNKTSKYKGVSKRDGVWVANICVDYKQKRLGRFTDEVEAALAYDKKAKELFGEYARLNFA